jgi:hypothetical protein
MTKPQLPLPAKMVRDYIQTSGLVNHPDCPFSFHLQPGDDRVVVLAGDNASGKSLLMNALASRAYYEHGVEPIVVSMTARTGEGMLRAFTYGNERMRATSEVSISVTLKALAGAKQRLTSPTSQTLVLLDEPDFGVAEGYAHAFGLKLAAALADLPTQGQWGLLVACHSRELVRGLVEGLGQNPAFVHTGQPITLDDWLKAPARQSVQALDQMLEAAKGQSKIVNQIQAQLREAQNARQPPTEPERKPRRAAGTPKKG